MAGKYEVYKDKSGGFRFRLKASNGEVIASSQSYKSKASALGGVESVKKNAASAVVDLTEDRPAASPASAEQIRRSLTGPFIPAKTAPSAKDDGASKRAAFTGLPRSSSALRYPQARTAQFWSPG